MDVSIHALWAALALTSVTWLVYAVFEYGVNLKAAKKVRS